MARRLLNHAWLLLALAASGCYKPAVDACRYRCSGTSGGSTTICAGQATGGGGAQGFDGGGVGGFNSLPAGRGQDGRGTTLAEGAGGGGGSVGRIRFRGVVTGSPGIVAPAATN